MTNTQKAQVEYTLEILEEYLPVRGNALASGDDELDKQAEDEIIERLERGDLWAWCTVKVTAKYRQFEGVSYLGGCSYEDEEQFKQPGGYYESMKAEALADLERVINEAKRTVEEYES